jgi:molecular chaperone DnaK
VDQDVAEVKGTRGNNTLGGADIDKTIVDWLVDLFETESGVSIRDDRVVLQRILDAAERAKISLSSAPEAEIHLPFLVTDADGPKHLQTTLTRVAFDQLVEPILSQTIQECRKAMEDAQPTVEEIDEIIMVGGSSRIPAVQEMVKEFFGKPLNKTFNPDEVVAIGASIQAAMLEGEIKSVTLLDVTNFSLGIEAQGDRFATLIPKNTTIPSQATRMVSTVVDNQKTVKIHVLQGESPSARENISLGTFELTKIPPAARGEPRVEVRFAIDSNGIVNVTAEDLGTGAAQEITIQAPTSLSQIELDRLREQAEAGESSAASQREIKQLRHNVERHLVRLEKALDHHRDTMNSQLADDVNDALKRSRMALLKSAEKSELDSVSEELESLYGKVQLG